MNSISEFFEKHISKILASAVIILLFVSEAYSYLIFHTLAEMISIGIAWAVFMLAWNAREFSKNSSLTFLGISYLFIGLLDLLHTLAYRGMTVFTANDTNLATQLWIAARYLQAASFVVFAGISKKRLNYSPVFLIYSVVAALLILSIFSFKNFPVCFIEGSGLTAFKIVSEYIICITLAISVYLLVRRRNDLDHGIYYSLVFSACFLVLTEMIFTFYTHPHDLLNQIGHFFKIISSFLIYKAIIESGVKNPFSLLFREIKHSEESLKGMNDELSHLNERLEIELEEKRQAEMKMLEAVKELERSNKELEQFAYVASHDLQEPLRMVSSYTKLLEKRYKEKLDPSATEYINFAVEGASRMQLLIRGLLDYSRISSQGKEYQPVDSNKILLNVLKNLEFAIKDEDALIHFKNLPIITCDELQILQLFQNLINNAIKFKRPGTRPEIDISAEKIDNKYLFRVKDNGIGISEEFSEKIFQIFQRLHSRTEYPGTGIGLAVCKRIVERHGGKIWVESEPDKGAVFLFTLPV